MNMDASNRNDAAEDSAEGAATLSKKRKAPEPAEIEDHLVDDHQGAAELTALLDQLKAKREKKSYSIKVRFYPLPEGSPPRAQADRDFIQQVMTYFCWLTRKKGTDCLTAVTAALPSDIQGYTTDRNPANPIPMVFRSVTQVAAMQRYLQAAAGDHHNVRICMSIDGSPFFNVCD